ASTRAKPRAATPRRAKSATPRRAKPARARARSRARLLLRRVAIVGVLAAALAVTYFAWLRDSSLVAVTNVEIDGLSGGVSNPAAAALTDAAKGMTTLDVDQGRLDTVAARYPEIASVTADPSFPHGMTLQVVERPPALIARDGGRRVAVAADGTLLVGD